MTNIQLRNQSYTLSENHTLDLAYGDDIYDMQFPSNYKFGQKID